MNDTQRHVSIGKYVIKTTQIMNMQCHFVNCLYITLYKTTNQMSLVEEIFATCNRLSVVVLFDANLNQCLHVYSNTLINRVSQNLICVLFVWIMVSYKYQSERNCFSNFVIKHIKVWVAISHQFLEREMDEE